MKLLRRLSLVVGIIVLFFVIRTAFLDRDYSFSRSTVIAAPVNAVFPLLADLENWQDWNPWLQTDPSIVLTFSDPAKGVGAFYLWSGEQSGSGKLIITKSGYLEELDYRIEFEGWEDLPSYGRFDLKAIDGSMTEITWTFEGSVGDGFFLRWLASMMETRVAPFMEQGLENLESEITETNS